MICSLRGVILSSLSHWTNMSVFYTKPGLITPRPLQDTSPKRKRWPIMSPPPLGILSLLPQILNWWFLWVSFSETHAHTSSLDWTLFRLIAQTQPRCYTIFAEPTAAVVVSRAWSFALTTGGCLCLFLWVLWGTSPGCHYSCFRGAWHG